MKKILIASACAFTLCLISCASKKAPAEQAQTQAPEAEAVEEQTDSNEESSENTTEESPAEEAADASEEEAFEALTSEDFPEPETIDEPEIITLEPQEEIAEEAPAPTEEIEKEEPPEITIVTQPEEDKTDSTQTSEDSSLAQNENEAANSEEDTSNNDVILVDNSSDSDGISGGIDITDDDASDSNSYTETQKDIVPSRSVTLKKFEYLDVTYPGSGWIYMGLTDNSKDLAYFGRKLGTKDTKFSLQARAAGTKIIHFCRNDPVTGQYLDDYIQVVITAENGSNKTHIEAPEYKLPVQKKEKTVKKSEEPKTQASEAVKTTDTTQAAAVDNSSTDSTKSSGQTSVKAAENKTAETKTSATKTSATKTTATSSSAAKTSTTSQTSTAAKADSTKASTSPSETAAASTADTTTATSSETNESSVKPADTASLLKEAQILYNEKEYSAALAKLNQFFEFSTDNRDEALYLQGQILEAKSDVRDIKGAIEAYSTLTKNYPASKLWDDANKRIIYLKRFYLEVR